jgi:hypothetical protein
MFGFVEVDLNGNTPIVNPIVNPEEESIVLAHAAVKNPNSFTGEIEPLVGWDYSKSREVGKDAVYLTPGTRIPSKLFTIDEYGVWRE